MEAGSGTAAVAPVAGGAAPCWRCQRRKSTPLLRLSLLASPSPWIAPSLPKFVERIGEAHRVEQANDQVIERERAEVDADVGLTAHGKLAAERAAAVAGAESEQAEDIAQGMAGVLAGEVEGAGDAIHSGEC